MIHLVVRYADSLFGGIDTVGLHKRVVELEGAVWFAKVGAPIGLGRLGRLNSQVLAGKPSYVYLVQRQERRYAWARGTLIVAQREFPENEKEMVPPYYEHSGVLRQAATWFKFSDLAKVDGDRCSDLVVASSSRPIHHALHGSMASMFFVRSNPNRNLAPIDKSTSP
ncbi:hypothetical protein ACFLSG_05000 [Candidatus Bipolaricaulota bacterium]